MINFKHLFFSGFNLRSKHLPVRKLNHLKRSVMETNAETFPAAVLEKVQQDRADGQDHQKKEKKDKKDKKKKHSRAVETMFRTTAGMNIRLSEIADEKAHFLLYINSILISVLVSLVLRNINEHPEYIIPSILFMITSLATFVLAILVTMPLITHGTFKKEDVGNKTADLLFFGNYHNMDIKEYQWAMTTMIEDQDFVYGNMIRDNFHLGQVLDKKFKRLRIAFWVFMFGFIISVAAFLLADYLT
jgi:hypothetical protein